MFEQLILMAALVQQPVTKENCERAFGQQQSPMNQRWTPRDFYVGCHALLKTTSTQVKYEPGVMDEIQDTTWSSSVVPDRAN